MKFLTLSSLLTAGLCLLLLGLRIGGAVSLSEPLHVVTSGWEEENLIALWEFIQGNPIYTSRFEIPFRGVLYNWLFYVAYGSAVAAVSGLFGLGDAWLGTIARLSSLAGVAVGLAVAWLSLRIVIDRSDRQLGVQAAAFAVLLMAGPLIGFWAITARPDVWAMVLEMSGILAFMRLYGSRRAGAVLILCLFAYAAWALKQSNITAAGAVWLFLLVRRDWRSLALLSAVMAVASGLTLGVGAMVSEHYLANLTLAEYTPDRTFGHLVYVVTNFAVKFIPVLAIGAAVAWMFAVERSLREALGRAWKSSGGDHDALILALAGLVVSVGLALPASPHRGAAEHYFFMVAYFLSLSVLSGLNAMRTAGIAPALPRRVGIIAWLLQGAAILTVIAGVNGIVSLRPMHEKYTAIKPCLDRLPRPLFVADNYLSLPWMTPGSLPFVLAYGYWDDRWGGRGSYQRGGVGGLIEEGFFAALALPAGETESYDDGPLIGYEPVDTTCGRFQAWLRKQG